METTELERYKAAFDRAIRVIRSAAVAIRRQESHMHFLADTLQRDADNLLSEIKPTTSPPPTYEEVTVERWTFGGGCMTYETEEMAKERAGDKHVYKLTGTRRVPVKQPVRKRVCVESEVLHGGYNRPIGSNEPTWGKHPECHGKTGTLTFEWEE